MFGHGPLQGFRVPPRSTADIRAIAMRTRDAFEIDGHIDLGRFLENLVSYSIVLHVIPDNGAGLPANVEACWVPTEFMLILRDRVYEAACSNDPRALFTVFHEMGHMALGHQRTINRETPGREIKTFEDSEWQANQFAAEFLMPLDVIQARRMRTEQQLMSAFGVSYDAARVRLNRLTSAGNI